jgi:hypothetical protein
MPPDYSDRQSDVERPSERLFGISVAVCFLISGLLPMAEGDAIRPWAIVVSIISATLAMALPWVLTPLNRLWTRLGLFLGDIVSWLALSIVFFLLVTPTGILMRLLGKDLLRLRLETDAESYWIERDPPGPAPDSFLQQF